MLSGNIAWLPIFLGAAFIVSVAANLIAFVMGYKLLHIPMNILFGIVAGAHSKPVVLG